MEAILLSRIITNIANTITWPAEIVVSPESTFDEVGKALGYFKILKDVEIPKMWKLVPKGDQLLDDNLHFFETLVFKFLKFSSDRVLSDTHSDESLQNQMALSLPNTKESKKTEAVATRIIAYRHGQTGRNSLEEEIQGQVDDEAAALTREGEKQAAAMGLLLAKQYPDASAIYTSPLKRCMQTASLVARRYQRAIDVLPDSRLKEINHGKNDTMSVKKRDEYCSARYKELEEKERKNNPDTPICPFFKWRYNPMSEIPSEKGSRFIGEPETVLQLFQRASKAFAEIGERHAGKTVLVSTHGGLIKTLMTEAHFRQNGDSSVLPVYYEKSEKLPLVAANCSIFHFVWKDGELTFAGTI